jgi:hypothetical protein
MSWIYEWSDLTRYVKVIILSVHQACCIGNSGQNFYEQSIARHISHPSTWEAEAGGSQI